MIKKIFNQLRKVYKNRQKRILKRKNDKINFLFFKNGQIPWSDGYLSHKVASIVKSITNAELLKQLTQKKLPANFGYRIDERIVEYPWIFSNLKKDNSIFLDAGSTFNFGYILNNEILENKKKYIYTFYPEDISYTNKVISYVYGDLRELPFKENYFEEIVCQSTIEHIDMNNSIYGYDLKSTLIETTKKSYEYLKVVNELLRVLKPEGQLLLTFPYGKFENHEFFQQFDREMVVRINDIMNDLGSCELTFFKYLPEGWIFSTQEDCDESESFNPHTQKGKKDDFAAHSRAICCIKFVKKGK